MIDEEIRQSLQEEFVLGIFWCFELDRKAQMDLSFSPVREKSAVVRPTRSCGTSFPFGPSLNLDYQDLSNKTSSMVTVAHRRIGSVGIWMQLLLVAVHFRMNLDAVAFGIGCSCSGGSCMRVQLQLHSDGVAF